MLKSRVIPLWILTGVILWLGFACQAEAYILPARFYLAKYARTRASFRRLRIKQMTTSLVQGKKQKREEVLYLQSPGNIRLEQRHKGRLVQVDIWAGKSWLHWKKGEATRRRRRPNPRLDLFAVESSGYGYGSIRSLLRRMRVFYRGSQTWDKSSDYREQNRVGLTWFVGHPVVILGAQRKDQKQNQLWLDKSRFVPLRFVGQLRKKGPIWDIRYLDYNKIGGRAVFPGRVEVYRNGKLTSRTLVYQIKQGSLPAHIFSRVR